MNDFQFYYDQLAGKNPETTPGTPHCGFYRLRSRRMIDNPNPSPGQPRKKPDVRYEAIAIWKDEGKFVCARQWGRAPEHQDEIDDLFSRCCRDAVTEADYRAVMDGGSWPDQVAERTAEQRQPEPDRLGPTETQEAMYGQGRAPDAPENVRATPGNNSAAVEASQVMSERIADVLEQFAAWLKDLPDGKITTQAQADKAANFASLLADLEKEADTTHRGEKEPWLIGGREVDGRWKPLIEKAAEAKKRIKNNYVAPYLAEQQRKAEAEAKAERDRLAAEHARQAQEAAAKGEDAPLPPPKVEVTKVGAGTRGGRATGLRVVKVAEITDLPALAAYLAGMTNPPADFLDTCRKLAEKMMKAGVAVPGAKLNDQNTAA